MHYGPSFIHVVPTAVQSIRILKSFPEPSCNTEFIRQNECFMEFVSGKMMAPVSFPSIDMMGETGILDKDIEL